VIPIIILGFCVGFILINSRDSRSSTVTKTVVETSGEAYRPAVDLTPHLTEFSFLIKKGHRPSQWLITEAVAEAWEVGKWELARTIAKNYPSDITIERRKKKLEPKKETPVKVAAEIEEEAEVPKQLSFSTEKATSPVSGINDDDWRMFVQASSYELPEFTSNNSLGMFRQNKKRLEKLGISVEKVKDPIEQYNAFEQEVVSLISEGNDLIKQSVAMPIEINGESMPITLSGLIAVMRIAGTSNAAKWLDSQEERKKFPNTTEAFKRANGCF
jgi:hypothetical protein